MRKIRIGGGSGYAGDRWEPAVELVERGEIDYLVLEALAERTIAREQIARKQDANRGYNPWLEARARALLAPARSRGVKIITNMGAANPRSAARRVVEIAAELGLHDYRVAAVIGDDVTEIIRGLDTAIMETGEPFSVLEPRMISGNAYLGADAIARGLATGADMVITGRVGDPSLFLAAMMDGLGWSYEDYHLIGQGMAVGHLLECAGQVTGGYFADPGYKDVPELHRLGFPIAEVHADGSVFITKVAGSGGLVTTATCKEQLLYEVHDPAAYITPDCVLDFTDVTLTQCGPDRVQVVGSRALPRTAFYKVSVGYSNGFLGEGQMSYGGPGAVERARLAAEVVEKRLALRGVACDGLRFDLIGVQSLHGTASPPQPAPHEVRLRVAGICATEQQAALIGAEVETLLTNGPYGGAGDFKATREIIAVLSVLLERERVPIEIVLEQSPSSFALATREEVAA